jgi:PAS domain S-box-containing protein
MDDRKKQMSWLASFPLVNPNPVLEISLDGRIGFANPSVRKLFPDLEERQMAHPYLAGWEEIVEKVRKEPGLNMIREAAVGDRTYQQAISFVEEYQRVRIYGLDITEGKKREAEREQMSARLEEERQISESLASEAQQRADELGATFAALAEAVIVYDANGNAQRANPAAVKALGFDPTRIDIAVLVGKLSTRYPDGRPVEPAKTPSGRALVGEVVTDERFIFTNTRGRAMTIIASASPLWKNGQISGAVVVWHDITEREQLLNDLQSRAAELETIMDTVPAIIWVSHDPQCLQMTGNRYSYEFLGIRPETNVSMSAPEEAPPLHHKACKDGQEVIAADMPMQISAATGEPSQDYEFEVVFENGTTHHLIGNATPLFDRAGQPNGAVSAFIDITERKLAEKALQKAHDELELRVQERTQELSIKNKQLQIEIEERKLIEQELRISEERLKEAINEEKAMRNQLVQAEKLSALARMVASVAHEINNPLQTIKNCIYLVNGETDSGSEMSQIMEMAGSEANRISDLVAKLRELYKPSKDQTPKPFDVLDVLNNVHSLLGPHLQNHHVEWKMTSDTDRVIVDGISNQIKQVLLNLCLNAVDAIKRDEGLIMVELSTLIPGQVRIAIEDNGEGILPEDMPHLFEPFFTTKDAGSGLGLSICYEIVKNFNGNIVVESQPGMGAKFTICLPRAG